MLSTPIYIISYFLNLSQIGSSANLPAHWEGGARARINQVFAKKFASPSEGEAEGGCGGNSASPERIQKADSPAVLLVQSRTPHKSFLFLLPPHQNLVWGFRRKNRARKLKNVKKTFLRGGEVSERRRGWLCFWGFCLKKVRISTKRYRQFTILSFLAELEAEQSSAEVALRAKKAEFARICHAPRGEKEMFWFWIWKFVWALPKAKQSFATNLFLFRLWRNLEAIIFNNILTYDKLK